MIRGLMLVGNLFSLLNSKNRSDDVATGNGLL